MNLFTIFQRFPDHEACIEHLEYVRWNDSPSCPLCGSTNVARKADGNRIGRWNCYQCKSSFNVLSKTIFQKTKIPLQKWFLATALILNAKKSASSHQLARDLDMNQKSAWYMAMRIRKSMQFNNEESQLLSGIVEADECYIGGRPRKPNKRSDDRNHPRGRGTDKMIVLAAVERNGRVVAQLSNRVSAKALTRFLSKNVDANSLLVTDQFRGYSNIHRSLNHATIDHSKQYVDGSVHTNTIEGFFSLLKRAWLGQHHHYTTKHAPAYITEACYKYNNRHKGSCFDDFMQMAVCI